MNQKLIKRIRGFNDLQAKHELILELRPIIMRYSLALCKIPNRREDVVCVGMLGLVQAVENISKGKKTDHILGYILLTVRGFVKSFLNKSPLIPISIDTFRRYLDKGLVDSLEDFRAKYVHLDFPTSTQPLGPTKILEEDIKNLLTDKEQMMFNLALKGYSVSEMAEILQEERQSIYYYIKKLKDHIKRILNHGQT